MSTKNWQLPSFNAWKLPAFLWGWRSILLYTHIYAVQKPSIFKGLRRFSAEQCFGAELLCRSYTGIVPELEKFRRNTKVPRSVFFVRFLNPSKDPSLSFHADLHQRQGILLPALYTVRIGATPLIVKYKRRNPVAQTLLQYA